MSGITLVVEDQNWRSHRGIQTRVKQAADAARKATKLKGGFTILLASNSKLRALNGDFRGKDKPTNVLSFPAGGDFVDGRPADASAGAYAGDIAIAYGVTRREAKDAGKDFADHA